MILSNQIKCLKCGDEPYSAHGHDMRHCKCGSVFVDGGTRYRRIGGDLGDMEDLSIVWSDEKAAYVTKEIETAMATGRNAFGILCAVARAMRDWDRGIDVETDNISTSPPSRDFVLGHVMKASRGTLNPKTVSSIIDGVLDDLATFEQKIQDPNAVHVNMLRGKIARPTETQIKHLYPELFKDEN